MRENPSRRPQKNPNKLGCVLTALGGAGLITVLSSAAAVAMYKILDDQGYFNSDPVTHSDTGEEVATVTGVEPTNTDAVATAEPLPNAPTEEPAPPVVAPSTAQPTEEVPPAVSTKPENTQLLPGWEVAPKKFSSGTSAQKAEEVKDHGSCAAYTFVCEDGVFKAGSDEFTFAPGCPEPQADWSGWESGKKVPILAKGTGYYERGLTAPADLCPQLPSTNDRVIHYFEKAQ